MLNPGAENCRRILASSPILTNGELNALRCIKENGFKAITLPALFNTDKSGDMDDACDTIFKAADIAIDKGYNIIILSDKNAGEKQAPIPALLVCAGLHHHLIRKGTRMKVSIVLETGEPREVHHMALLVGYGANAVNPYLVYDIIDEYTKSGIIETDSETAKANYKNAVTKGIISVASKMGISTMQSYQGAQIFEALGVSQKVVDKYFSGTVTRIGGITEADIENEVLVRTDTAFDPVTAAYALESGGNFKWRSNGEYHMFNPDTVYKLQMACRTGDYKL